MPQPQAMIFVHLSLYCTFSHLWDMGSHHYEDQKIQIYWHIHIGSRFSLRVDHPLWLLTLPPMLVCHTSLLVQTWSPEEPVWTTYSNKLSCTWVQLRAYTHSQESLALRQFHGHFSWCVGCCWNAICLTLPSACLLFTVSSLMLTLAFRISWEVGNSAKKKQTWHEENNEKNAATGKRKSGPSLSAVL